LAERVYPLIPVEKTPDIVYDIGSLRRAFNCFPHSRFIHLLRHPRGYCESNLRYYLQVQQRGQTVPPWMFCSSAPSASVDEVRPAESQVLDPQRGWYLHNMRILKFLESVPDDQKTWVTGEEAIADPDGVLRRIVRWLGVRDDSDAISQMKHPENSPFAFIGPPNALYGNSRKFLEDPILRPDSLKNHSLEGPLAWRDRGVEFLPEVKQLAMKFGYR